MQLSAVPIVAPKAFCGHCQPTANEVDTVVSLGSKNRLKVVGELVGAIIAGVGDRRVGSAEGAGGATGCLLGVEVGFLVVAGEGDRPGGSVGVEVGLCLGPTVGIAVGSAVGVGVGSEVRINVGCGVG